VKSSYTHLLTAIMQCIGVQKGRGDAYPLNCHDLGESQDLSSHAALPHVRSSSLLHAPCASLLAGSVMLYPVL